MYSAHRSQIVASLREMSRSYGSVDGYVEHGLGITPEGLEKIRHNLLETRRA
ncbi:tyrosine-protein phosphatase [Mycobacterium sp.]|uniref:tyrosine-protein phosphatase n=1 Tax=Mycobacterium sp. TaxID=1785 RepID=UPI003BAB0741